MIPLPHIDLLQLQDRINTQKDPNGIVVVFDPIRRKRVRATPEEIVRQLWIVYLLETLHLNAKLIAVERAIALHGSNRRFDLVVFDKTGTPLLLAEFKSPDVAINQGTFDQIGHYNLALQVPYALVSNGRQHYCFRIDDVKKGFEFLEDIPVYP